jgi:hypothetical protein
VNITNAQYWTRRAARVRERANVATLADKKRMLETANHYDLLAEFAKPTEPVDAQNTVQE